MNHPSVVDLVSEYFDALEDLENEGMTMDYFARAVKNLDTLRKNPSAIKFIRSKTPPQIIVLQTAFQASCLNIITNGILPGETLGLQITHEIGNSNRPIAERYKTAMAKVLSDLPKPG